MNSNQESRNIGIDIINELMCIQLTLCQEYRQLRIVNVLGSH